MKFPWKNIENWRSWKMRFFWGGHFEFSKSAILNFFLLHISEKPSPFIWGIIFFCTMDGFSRILEKKGGGLLCTRLYLITNLFFSFNLNPTGRNSIVYTYVRTWVCMYCIAVLSVGVQTTTAQLFRGGNWKNKTQDRRKVRKSRRGK